MRVRHGTKKRGIGAWPGTKKKPQMTLDKIRKNFKDIRGHLSPDNDILKGVDLNKLYAFIKAHDEIRTQSMYSIVDLYRQESGV